MNPLEFFSEMKKRYALAEKSVGSIQKSISVGELTVNMHFAGASLIPTFFNAFNHLESEVISEPSNILSLYFWDSSSTQTSGIADIPWAGQLRHHLGLIESYTNDEIFTLQQPGSEAIYIFNKTTNEGIYWVERADKIPYWESDFPLRMYLHWWLRDTPYQPVHAGAVGTNEGGLLLVGKGGSGKSTSTLSCLNSSLRIAGDDYVLLNTNSAMCYSLFSLSKLNDNSIQLLKHKGLDHNKLPRPIDDKYRIKLYPEYRDSMINDIPIKAIILPQVTSNEKTRIEKGNAADAMLALAPTTLFQLPALREIAFNKMAGFARRMPCYKLLLGKDSRELPELFAQLLKSLQSQTKS